MKIEKKQAELIYAAIVIIIPFAIVLAGIGKLNGIFFPPDEFGYWESAASILGKDWKNISSLQSFYAKGYGLILAPIMAMIDSSIIMYRVAILLNAVMVAVTGLVLPELVKTLIPGIDQVDLLFSCIPASLYVGTLSYMHYTLAESLLQVCFVLLCLFWAKYCQTKGFKLQIIILLLSSYLFLSHYRTFPILIVTLILFAITGLKNENDNGLKNTQKRICVIGILVIMLLLLGCSLWFIRKYSLQDVYLQDQLIRLKSCFGRDNIWKLLMGFCGKCTYLTIASFGLTWVSVYFLIKHCKLKTFSIFFIISLLGCLLVSTAFFGESTHLDYVFYGRYTEFFVPVLIAIGFSSIGMIEQRDIIKYVNLIGVPAFMTIYLLYVSFSGTNVEYRNDFIPAIAWAVGSNPKSVSLIAIKVVIVFSLLQFEIFGRGATNDGGQNSETRKILKSKHIVETVCGILFLILALSNVSRSVYPYHQADISDIALFKTINQEEQKERKIVFFDNIGTNYVGLMQFYLKDSEIDVIDGNSSEERARLIESTTPEKCVIATYIDDLNAKGIAVNYEHCMKSEHFILYY